MRYERRQVWSSVMGFNTLTLSSLGSPEFSNSSLSELRVSVVTSVNPRPTITSRRSSEMLVMGISPPVVWETSILPCPNSP